MAEAYIVDGVRTPIGSHGGALSDVRPDDMAAHAIAELMRRHPDADPASIADVVLGCANQAGEDNRNVARMASLLAGLPVTVPGETVNRLCASGLSAVASVSRAIHCDEGELFVAGGVESMTRAPFVMGKSAQPFGREVQMFDTSIGWRFVNARMQAQYGVDAMGETAENVAEERRVSREAQDRFACRSQEKAAAARAAGRFEREIAPVTIPQRKGDPRIVAQDEFIRPGTTVEILAKLKPAFRSGGSVTAGNSSGVNDGAAALLIASERAVERYGLTPLARITASTAVGVEPRIMGIGPDPAVHRLLDRTGLAVGDIDVFELNEAFASQSLQVLRALGLPDDAEHVNPNGGAIALGHPLGMSGARLALTAAIEMVDRGAQRAVATMCVGVGQGSALLLERA
jgi:3-oxoadipyl-CoA thiolase